MIFLSADVFQSVLVIDMNSAVVKSAGCFSEIFAAYGNDTLIYLYHVYPLNRLVSCKLTDSSAVTRTDNQHLFYIGI